jgi:hypothetical protein
MVMMMMIWKCQGQSLGWINLLCWLECEEEWSYGKSEWSDVMCKVNCYGTSWKNGFNILSCNIWYSVQIVAGIFTWCFELLTVYLDNLHGSLTCDTSGPHICNTDKITVFIKIVVSTAFAFQLCSDHFGWADHRRLHFDLPPWGNFKELYAHFLLAQTLLPDDWSTAS